MSVTGASPAIRTSAASRRRAATRLAGDEALVVSLSRYALYLVVLIHFVSLSGYTSSLDEIKRIVMWVGGSASIVGAFALLATRQVRLPSKVLCGAFAAVLLTKLLSVFAAESYAQWIGWEEMRNWYAVFGFTFLAAITHSTRRAGLESLLFFAFLSLVLCAFGAVHYAGILKVFIPTTIDPENKFQLVMATLAGQLEMYSLIFNTQFFGNILVFLLPLSICAIFVFPFWKPAEQGELQPVAYLTPATRVLGGVALAVLLLICFCIPLTYSKITLLSTPVAVLIFYFGLPLVARISPPKVPYLPLLLGFLVLNALTLYPFIQHDLTTRFSTLETSTDSRVIIWDGAWQMFLSSPLLGTGAGSFRIYFPTFRSPDYHLNAISNVTLSAHNWLFDALSQTGILGTAALLFFLGALAWGLLRMARTSVSKHQKLISLGYLAGIAAFMTACLATPILCWPVGMVSFAMLVGIASGVASHPWDDREIPQSPEWYLPVGVVGVAVCGLFFPNMYSWASNFFMAAIYHQQAVQVGAFSPQMEQSTDAREMAFRLENYSKGVKSFAKVAELNPTYITSYYRCAHYENQMANTYRVMFAQALKQNSSQIEKPEVQQALQTFASRYSEHQDNALKQYRLIQQYAPDYSEIHNNIAILESAKTSMEREFFNFFNPGQTPEAEKMNEWRESYKRSLESIQKATTQSNKISIWHLQGTLYEDASNFYSNADPEFSDYLTKSGEAFEKAAQLPLTQATQQENQIQTEKQMRLLSARKCINNYMLAQNWAKASEAAVKLAPLYPSIPEIPILGAEAILKNGDVEKASAFLEEQIERNPTSPNLYLQRLRLTELSEAFAAVQPIEKQMQQINRLKSLITNFFTPQQQQAVDVFISRLNQPAQ